ncbi:uncharacterized protein LOC136081480 [Hydra vulgaris]|uniref:Uncharacterized protein LOC136081480 n=1 Tax=Hydra vulgaris TaxID=6087 RepID=A0ABM4C023_HYDVU
MERTDIKTGETIITSAPFRTNNQVVLEPTDLDEFYEISKQKILESLSSFQQLGSAKSYIPLNKNLATKKAIINMKNEDNQCFKYTYRNSEESSSKHIPYCETHDSVRIELPSPKSTMQFTNHNKSMRVPFVVYADFESFIKPIDTCEPNPNDSYTKQYQKHIPSSFCYYIKCFDESFCQGKLVTFTASSETDNVAKKFVDSLQEDIKKIYHMIKFLKKIIFTPENKHDFNSAISCHICGKKLNKDKVRDHCHITGKYRGAVHQNYGKKVEIKRELRFLDSYRFMPDSLDALSKNLAKDKCKNIGKFYSGKKLDLLLRKCVYPYDWVDSINKFSETQLPPKESFFSRLNAEDLSDDDYSHAQIVWKDFNCKTFRDYHDLYNVSDVLLLADVFENFRDLCINIYDLDPAWYYTSPGLAWNAALKKTKIKLELLSDYDMILMIKKGIRGDIFMIYNRLGTSNNKYMVLNGWKFKKWKSIPCILEVDLDYPEHLHDEHNDYPLGPERLTINRVEKCVLNLNNKKNYLVHHENPKLYERLGLKITKILRGIIFEESAWLKFFKLMNYSVFRKTKENIENRVDIRLVTDRNEANKLASKPNFERVCILDLSKTLMYEFHYDYIKKKYSDRAKLLFTDTDSLAYEIKTEDIYADIAKDIESKFYTSDFDKDYPAINKVGFKVGANNKVLGMFKDESKGAQIEEFVGLRSKLYSYKVHGEEKKKCKGVKKNVVKKYITHEDYKGVFVRDELPKNTQRKECEILNTGDSSTRGFHWICWYKDGDKKLSFDSYGLPPPVGVDNYLKSPVYYNNDRVQFENTSFYGHLCLYVLKKLDEGYDFQNIMNNL